ncbi:MAG TPA: hypothetical protein DEF51_29360 [Myxococcales bacterium]|nr:hypothetical protein [Myxococcales bacterium]
MVSEAQPVRAPDIERAVSAVREAGDVQTPLAALALDLLSRQAEGRTFYAGEKLVAARAEAHGVTREAAATEAGNLLAILERGPDTPLERALVAAFAVAGLAAAKDADRKERVWRFVRHADWLELCTDYAVYPFVDRLLEEGRAADVWAELAQAVVDEAAGRDGERPEVRARNAGRLSALADSNAVASKDALRRVVSSAALDEPTRLLASTLAGDGAAELSTAPARVEGELGRAPRGSALELLRWLSGWAILSWAIRGLGFLLGVRRKAELTLNGGAVTVRTELSMLGRVIRGGEERWRLDALDGAGRRVRYPALHLMVGVVALAVGVLFGGVVLFDGARSGELVLLLLAAGLLLGGAALDLALDVLVPGKRGRVVLDVSARSRRPLRLTRVPLDQADAFLRALRGQG